MRFFLLLLLLLAACAAPQEPQDARRAQIRELIDDNLHLSAHMTRAADRRTFEAVRPHVDAGDIPHLAALLGDGDGAVGYAAMHLLEDFGDRAVPALEAAAWDEDPRRAAKAREALATIAAAQRKITPEGEVDYSCRVDSDCAIKDIGSCCGYRPACVNKDSPTFPERVQARCAAEGISSVCGFPEIAGCACIEGRCENIPGPAIDIRER